MSNNSMVCRDGAEIGRAQYLQAQAAGVEASSAMNPVLLKPGSDRRSFVVVRGRAAGTLEAGEFASGRAHLAEAAFAAYAELADEFDVVIAEGAGSPAEINLRAGDYVNMGLARRWNLPVVVVGDIDRGGVFASLYGTVGLLDDDDRELVRGFVLNKFRGDASLLDPALRDITARTGVPFLGTIPWLVDVWLDSEDTLAFGARPGAVSGAELSVAVVRLPRVSNATDIDALAAEPGVRVDVTVNPGAIANADVVVIPGSRATVDDLHWLRSRGLDEVITRRVAFGKPVLGICGGYQMLARTIDDQIESGRGVIDGFGLLPVSVRFAQQKVLDLPTGDWRGHPVSAYEIHHGVADVHALDGASEPFLDGVRRGPVWGTMWHGAFENDNFRRAWLGEIAAIAESSWRPETGAPSYAARRELMIDTLADAIEQHCDVEALLDLVS